MDLQTLKFKVETGELVSAVTAVKNLGQEVAKLNKPLAENAKANATAAKEQSRAEEAASKAALTALKLATAQEKGTQKAKESVSVLERQNLILEYMAQGNSRGQASIMATFKAAGALDSQMLELNKTLQTQRTLIGGDPFDKSIGLLNKLQNEYKTTSEVTSLFARNLGLTEKQMIDIAREKERLIALYKIEGKDVSTLSNEYEKLIQQSVAINAQNDKRTSAMRSQTKAVNDSAKANAYLEKELHRVDTALKEENKELTSGSTNALLRFEAALKKSGKTASEQVKALEDYRIKLAQLNKASGNRQVDYLARALGPQITDIGVGLATGQNPMTVLLQQGGQLRDQLALAGVAGKDMGKALTDAANGMVGSIKDVAMAVGGLLVNAFTGVGKAIIGSVLMPLRIVGTALSQAAEGTLTMERATKLLGMALKSLATSGIMLVVTALATIVVEGYKFLSLQSDLSKAIALTGASMGMSTKQAVALAESMSKSGGSTTAYMAIITEFAKAGAYADEKVIKLAKDMDKYLGKSANKTAEELAKIGDKPLNGLLETAKATGFVSKATLDNVHSLEQQGKTYEAIKVAQDAYVAANQKVVDQVKAEMNPAQELWMKIKDGVTAAGEAIYDFVTSSLVIKVVSTVWETFAVIVSEVWFVLKQTVQTVIDLFNVLTAPVGTKLAVFDAAMENAKKAREEHDKTIAIILKRKDGTEGLTEAEIKLRKANADAAKTAEERYKKEDEAATLYKNTMANFANIIAESSTEQKVLNKAQQDYIALLNNPAYAYFSKTMKDNAKVQAEAASKAIENQKGRTMIIDENRALEEQNKTLALQTSLIGSADVVRQKALKTRESQIQLDKDLYTISKFQLDDIDKLVYQDAAYQRHLDRLKNVDIEIDNIFREERMTAYGSAFENVFKGMGDAIVTFVQTGKFSMKSLVDNLIADLIRFEVQAQTMAMYRGMNGAAGIMGFLGMSTGNTGVGMGSIGSVDTAALPAGSFKANGAAYTMGGIEAFAKGGSFTNSIVDSPTLFKFAKGTGMMGEAGPEAIMPLRRGSDGSLGVAAAGAGSGSTQINIINNSGVEAKTKETIDSRGNRKIDVMIGDVAATEVQRSGSSSQKAMKSTYGMQPNLIRR